jgi:hypothetical protein
MTMVFYTAIEADVSNWAETRMVRSTVLPHDGRARILKVAPLVWVLSQVPFDELFSLGACGIDSLNHEIISFLSLHMTWAGHGD